MTKEEIAESFRRLQDFICDYLEKIDRDGRFLEDNWRRENGGGGRTRILDDGAVIEKGGVNFSEVYGDVTDLMRQNTEIKADSFFATGVSIVLHPHNPWVPIIHMNVRYFELSDGTYWFGGGIDLTPHYVIDEHATVFHRNLKGICDKYDSKFYSKFKSWADDYFFIPHRDETRGVGGIFFDHLNADNSLPKKDIHRLCIELGEAFPRIYHEQVEFGQDKEFTIEELKWRNLRRGRYVEFNLVNDRGTKFGLVSGGRTESILMSLPATAEWQYNFEPEIDSLEYQTLIKLKKGVNYLQNG